MPLLLALFAAWLHLHAPDVVGPGDRAVLVVSAFEAGPITLTLPPELEPLSVRPSQGACTITGQGVLCEPVAGPLPLTVVVATRARPASCGPSRGLVVVAEAGDFSASTIVRLRPEPCPPEPPPLNHPAYLPLALR